MCVDFPDYEYISSPQFSCVNFLDHVFSPDFLCAFGYCDVRNVCCLRANIAGCFSNPNHTIMQKQKCKVYDFFQKQCRSVTTTITGVITTELQRVLDPTFEMSE